MFGLIVLVGVVVGQFQIFFFLLGICMGVSFCRSSYTLAESHNPPHGQILSQIFWQKSSHTIHFVRTKLPATTFTLDLICSPTNTLFLSFMLIALCSLRNSNNHFTLSLCHLLFVCLVPRTSNMKTMDLNRTVTFWGISLMIGQNHFKSRIMQEQPLLTIVLLRAPWIPRPGAYRFPCRETCRPTWLWSYRRATGKGRAMPRPEHIRIGSWDGLQSGVRARWAGH